MKKEKLKKIESKIKYIEETLMLRGKQIESFIDLSENFIGFMEETSRLLSSLLKEKK
jgi:hypothetical protein